MFLYFRLLTYRMRSGCNGSFWVKEFQDKITSPSYNPVDYETVWIDFPELKDDGCFSDIADPGFYAKHHFAFNCGDYVVSTLIDPNDFVDEFYNTSLSQEENLDNLAQIISKEVESVSHLIEDFRTLAEKGYWKSTLSYERPRSRSFNYSVRDDFVSDDLSPFHLLNSLRKIPDSLYDERLKKKCALVDGLSSGVTRASNNVNYVENESLEKAMQKTINIVKAHDFIYEIAQDVVRYIGDKKE